MKTKQLSWQKFSLSFPEGQIGGMFLGSGAHLLIGLPGYGNTKSLFQPLFTEAPPNCCVCLLDLPEFGESHWEMPELVASPDFLQRLLGSLRDKFSPHFLHLMGFSVGGKYALGIFQASLWPIRSMILIAPDGFKLHPLYRFCMYNPLGRFLFRFLTRRPGILLGILKVLRKLRIADAFQYAFVKRQFEDPVAAERLRKVWQINSGIRPRLARLQQLSREWDTRWNLIWGRKDNILSLKVGQEAVRKIPGAQLTVLEGGHALLQKNLPEVKEAVQKALRGAMEIPSG